MNLKTNISVINVFNLQNATLLPSRLYAAHNSNCYMALTCASPARQTHQKPLHSLCKMAQLKGIDIQVNTMVLICERMVFDFNWLLQSNHWLQSGKQWGIHNTTVCTYQARLTGKQRSWRIPLPHVTIKKLYQ